MINLYEQHLWRVVSMTVLASILAQPIAHDALWPALVLVVILAIMHRAGAHHHRPHNWRRTFRSLTGKVHWPTLHKHH